MTIFHVPEPGDYGPDDFRASTERVEQAKERLLREPSAADAYRSLGEEIAGRIDRKRATLAQVRRAVGLTQEQLAAMLHIGQGDVSRLEQRSNLQLATLARFVEATGGRLRISAVYGESEVALEIGDVAPGAPADEPQPA